MTSDPIIDDIRRIREGMARSADYKIDRVFAALRQSEARHDPEHRLVEEIGQQRSAPVVREDDGSS